MEFRNNDNLPRGRQSVVSEGRNGEAVVTYRTVKIGNQEVRRELARDVVSQPVPQVVEVGTGKKFDGGNKPWLCSVPQRENL